MAEEKLSAPAPVVLAMVICDAIHQDPATQKCTLLGTFSTINVRKFPAVHRQLACHVALTNGHGKTTIRLALASVDANVADLFSKEGVIEFRDPRAVAELNIAVNNITFPKPGEYRLQVYGNGELLSERRLLVLEIGSRQPPPVS